MRLILLCKDLLIWRPPNPPHTHTPTYPCPLPSPPTPAPSHLWWRCWIFLIISSDGEGKGMCGTKHIQPGWWCELLGGSGLNHVCYMFGFSAYVLALAFWWLYLHSLPHPHLHHSPFLQDNFVLFLKWSSGIHLVSFYPFAAAFLVLAQCSCYFLPWFCLMFSSCYHPCPCPVFLLLPCPCPVFLLLPCPCPMFLLLPSLPLSSVPAAVLPCSCPVFLLLSFHVLAQCSSCCCCCCCLPSPCTILLLLLSFSQWSCCCCLPCPCTIFLLLLPSLSFSQWSCCCCLLCPFPNGPAAAAFPVLFPMFLLLSSLSLPNVASASFPVYAQCFMHKY